MLREESINPIEGLEERTDMSLLSVSTMRNMNINSIKHKLSHSNPPTTMKTSGRNVVLYKTEICRNFMNDNGFCIYGDTCHFAHGLTELRTANSHPKHKTQRCKFIENDGRCPYGNKCHFRHDDESLIEPQMTEGRLSGENNDDEALKDRVEQQISGVSRDDYFEELKTQTDNFLLNIEFNEQEVVNNETTIDKLIDGLLEDDEESPIRRTLIKSLENWNSGNSEIYELSGDSLLSQDEIVDEVPVMGLLDGLWKTSRFGSRIQELLFSPESPSAVDIQH